MANIDTDYLDLLVKRFNGFNRPTDAQRLIMLLGERKTRSDDENKKLSVLLRAEKKSDELVLARAATRRVLNAEKTAARKLETRKKVLWGAALKTASKDSPQIAALMLQLFNGGYISEKDKDVVKSDLPAITDPNDPNYCTLNI